MLVPDKDPHMIAAEKLIAEAGRAVERGDYEGVPAMAALAQAHVAVSRHEAAIDADTDVIGHLEELAKSALASEPWPVGK